MKRIVNTDIEKKYRTIFEEGPLGMAIVDLNYFFIEVNNKFCEMTGYSAEELKKLTFAEITHPEDLNIDISLASQLFNGELQHYNLRKRYIRKNKEIFWINLTATIIKDESNKPLYFLSMVEDINEKVEFEEKLKESELQLRKINKDKDKLFSIIAHDLRSPFTTLQGFTEILLEDIDDLTKPEITQYLQSIYASSKNLMNLLDNLLSWSRLNTGSIIFQPEPVDLVKLIQDIIKVFMFTGKSKKINISAQFNSKEHVICDRNMISTIIRNLLGNALKFTAPGGSIIVNSAFSENNYEITIKDNGLGINPDRVKEIVSKDVIHSLHGTDNESGTGIGLKLVKEFVAMHKGTLFVESELGKGSTFKIIIPKTDYKL